MAKGKWNKCGLKAKGERLRVREIIYVVFLVCLLPLAFCPLPSAFGAWPGVDESVVEKYAREHGREAREPFINTDQGDLLLFVFLLAGSVGGFAAGYCWRMLVAEKGARRTEQ